MTLRTQPTTTARGPWFAAASMLITVAAAAAIAFSAVTTTTTSEVAPAPIPAGHEFTSTAIDARPI